MKKEKTTKDWIDPVLIVSEKEYPTSKEPYQIIFSLRGKVIKQKWLNVKKKIFEVSELRRRYGFREKGSLPNTEVVLMMIHILDDVFKARERRIKETLKGIRKRVLRDEIELFLEEQDAKN